MTTITKVVDERFLCRRDTEANWAAANPILGNGEIGFVTDGATGQPRARKDGNGVTAWNSLPYSNIFWAVAAGTGNAITAAFDPVPYLFDGLFLCVRAFAPNTGAVTFSPSGLTARPLTKLGGRTLSPGDIAAEGHELLIRYRSSVPRWELMNPSPLDTQLSSLGDGEVLTWSAALQKWANAAPTGGGGGGGTGVTIGLASQLNSIQLFY